MMMKLSWYKFKLHCCSFRLLNIISMVIIKSTYRKNKNINKEKMSKCFTTKKHLNTKEDNGRHEGPKSVRHIENK